MTVFCVTLSLGCYMTVSAVSCFIWLYRSTFRAVARETRGI